MATNLDTIQLLPNQSRQLAFFNQFGIYNTGELVELHFAFGRSTSDAFGGIIVVVAKAVLNANKDSFLKYLKRIEMPKGRAGEMCRVREPKEVLFADFIGLARQGEMGEIVFHAISWKSAIDRSKSEKSEKKDEFGRLKADLVALLRSDMEVHRNWVSLLYVAEK